MKKPQDDRLKVLFMFGAGVSLVALCGSVNVWFGALVGFLLLRGWLS